jgi:phosphate starvation-inducible protein PhoH and related proteins
MAIRTPKIKRPTTQLYPMNENQDDYIKALEKNGQVVVIGSSGTGKTYVAATYAAQMLQAGLIEKIVLTRPNVSVGRDLGYFPGTLLEKITPWAQPVLEVLFKHLGKQEVATYIKEGVVEIAPLSTMRGRSFEKCFILLDEAQNATPAEMKMFLTRIGEDCKLVVNGDIQQNDLRGNSSGLDQIVDMIDRYKLDIPIIEFTVDDIVRSKVCKQWIISYDKYEKGLRD